MVQIKACIEPLRSSKIFDYLRICTSVVLSFTGCNGTTQNITMPLPLLAEDWKLEDAAYEADFEASLVSNPIVDMHILLKCLGVEDIEDYDDYTWDFNYEAVPPLDAEITGEGREVTEYFPPEEILEQMVENNILNKNFNVYVKTGDIYATGDEDNPKYLEASSTNCIKTHLEKRLIYAYSGIGITHNGKLWISAYRKNPGSTTAYPGVLNIMPSSSPTDLKINDQYYKYGFIEVGSSSKILYTNGSNLYAIDTGNSGNVYEILSNGSTTTIRANLPYTISISGVYQDYLIRGVSVDSLGSDAHRIYKNEETETIWYNNDGTHKDSGLPYDSDIDSFLYTTNKGSGGVPYLATTVWHSYTDRLHVTTMGSAYWRAQHITTPALDNALVNIPYYPFMCGWDPSAAINCFVDSSGNTTMGFLARGFLDTGTHQFAAYFEIPTIDQPCIFTNCAPIFYSSNRLTSDQYFVHNGTRYAVNDDGDLVEITITFGEDYGHSSGSFTSVASLPNQGALMSYNGTILHMSSSEPLKFTTIL